MSEESRGLARLREVNRPGRARGSWRGWSSRRDLWEEGLLGAQEWKGARGLIRSWKAGLGVLDGVRTRSNTSVATENGESRRQVHRFQRIGDQVKQHRRIQHRV